MKKFFVNFLASKLSGWLALLLMAAIAAAGAFVTKQVHDYKELQVKAAYCEGQLSVKKVLERVQDRAVRQVERGESDVVEEIENEVEDTQDFCARQRAPKSLLEYHGLYD